MNPKYACYQESVVNRLRSCYEFRLVGDEKDGLFNDKNQKLSIKKIKNPLDF